MVEVMNEFGSLRIGGRFSMSFQRTLRIPDDGQVYPLPPGLGTFPVHHVEDFRDRVPTAWRERGGVFIPMYQREAMWLSFHTDWWKPNAVKIGIGNVNAVSGGTWSEELHEDPQDYMVCPDQPWLDGINAGDGFIRQFVAMPLGVGYTVEAQLTGSEDVGGVQILVYEPKPGRFPDEPPTRDPLDDGLVYSMQLSDPSAASMGLGAGGKMKQSIYPDPYGLETWDTTNYCSAVVHIVNSEQYRDITGLEPPPTPVSADLYTSYGFPWFALYDEAKSDLAAPGNLAGLKSIKAIDGERDLPLQQDDESVEVPPAQITHLLPTPPKP